MIKVKKEEENEGGKSVFKTFKYVDIFNVQRTFRYNVFKY